MIRLPLRRPVSYFIVILLLSCVTFGKDNSRSRAREWPSYGHDQGGMRFSPLKQINRDNVAHLQKAWTYHTGELKSQPTHGGRSTAFECTPLVIDGVLYLSTPSSRVIALDAETGKEIWTFDSQEGSTGSRKIGVTRGVAYWEGTNTKTNLPEKRILFASHDARLFAIEASTGKLCPDFGKGHGIDLREGPADNWPKLQYEVSSPPAIYKDLVIIGAAVPERPSKGPSGDVRAFDVRSGKLVWQFHTVPRPGETGHQTWQGDSWKDRTGINVWSIMSVDIERGLVFLPLGSPAYDFYGGDRKGENLFGNSLAALDAASGKLRWHYQIVHHDIWDYDLPAQPNLVTLRRNGRDVAAVAQVTKMGLVFVLDRMTGKPLFPVEERPFPKSKVPGESTWPTQPFPLKPPPLSRQFISRSDLTDVTPESQKYCSEFYDSLVGGGLYTPLGLGLTLYMPGTLGGGTWAGGSFDPATGYLFVNVNEVGAVGLLKPQPQDAPVAYARSSQWGEYARFWDEKHYPCQKPPWGTLNAVDLNRGEIAWKVPLGVVDELQAKGVKQTGALSLGGSIATAGGIVFIGGTNDSRFRAFDSGSGKELWVTSLDASGHATPVTYEGRKSRKQYVVIAAGGGGSFSHTVADTVEAFALPDR